MSGCSPTCPKLLENFVSKTASNKMCRIIALVQSFHWVHFRLSDMNELIGSWTVWAYFFDVREKKKETGQGHKVKIILLAGTLSVYPFKFKLSNN